MVVVAQSVERRFVEPEVAGAEPVNHPNYNPGFILFFLIPLQELLHPLDMLHPLVPESLMFRLLSPLLLFLMEMVIHLLDRNILQELPR